MATGVTGPELGGLDYLVAILYLFSSYSISLLGYLLLIHVDLR